MKYILSNIIFHCKFRRMDAAGTRVVNIIITVLLLVGLYYLYQYLFTNSTASASSLLGPKTNAQTEPAKPIIIPASNLPGLYEGGEFSVSMWVYVQNWNYRMGMNKHILSIGGSSFDTLRIYLGGNKPQFRVRVHTHTQGQVAPGHGGHDDDAAPSPPDNLSALTKQSLYSQLETDSGLLDSTPLCDLPEIDMQRWVQLTVALNGKTVDVYLDGKLARSCVLPTFYKVDKGGYNATLLAYGGYGGYISAVNMYSYARSPDQVYREYMAGPSPIGDFGTYIKSFFEPQTQINV